MTSLLFARAIFKLDRLLKASRKVDPNYDGREKENI